MVQKHKKDRHLRIWIIVRIPLSLGKNSVPPEVAAIKDCAELLKQKAANEIPIFLDSQAAVKTQDWVGSCLSAFNELDTQDKVTLAGVPRHKGHKYNKKVDAKAPEP